MRPQLRKHTDSISKINELIEMTRTRSRSLSTTTTRQTRNSSFSNMEVTLPAWMFLQLYPYYTDFALKNNNHSKNNDNKDNQDKLSKSREFEKEKNLHEDEKIGVEMIENTHSSDDDDDDGDEENESAEEQEGLETEKLKITDQMYKAYKNRRPLVPICLKRYLIDESGKTQKINRKFDIPSVINLPSFMISDQSNFENNSENGKFTDSFRLVLESAVCHRGNSIDSGHYVSFVRKYPFEDNYTAKDEEEAEWLLFNDMKEPDEKIKEMNFKEMMESESPYLLFYKVKEYPRESFSSAPENRLNSSSDSTLLQKLSSNISSTLFKERNNTSDDISNKSETNSIGPSASSKDLRKNSIISNFSQFSRKGTTEEVKKPSSSGNSESNRMNNISGNNANFNNSVKANTLSTGITSDLNNNNNSTNDETLPRLNYHNRQHIQNTLQLSKTKTRSSSQKSRTSIFSHAVASESSISPSDLNYIELSDRYFWYIQDADGNFVREEKLLSDQNNKNPILLFNEKQNANDNITKDENRSPMKSQGQIITDTFNINQANTTAVDANTSLDSIVEHSLNSSKIVVPPSEAHLSNDRNGVQSVPLLSPESTKAISSSKIHSLKPVASEGNNTKKSEKKSKKLRFRHHSHEHRGDKCAIV
ncbi:hypothetical protein PACTADRAFT_52051 [Pachysolen tannophilus NRRL Y-2460]|uniref:ubiquitinyl hydrolase 1 n=1 Tax=Pachysolen tannophilus NRRL Y-2460 TaxID=669874 RepID=A0A1E4TP66_PACTA|nr:hypothetical protein PACTADRAFT_52051 [Pachysolen tannophilus NRRL Y-2460]